MEDFPCGKLSTLSNDVPYFLCSVESRYPRSAQDEDLVLEATLAEDEREGRI